MDADEPASLCLSALEGRAVVQVPGVLNDLIAALAHGLPQAWALALSTAFSHRYRRRPWQGETAY